MKSLETIQKVFKVFKILSKIGMVLSFVIAGMALLGTVCSIIWQNGGVVANLRIEEVLSLTETAEWKRLPGELLSDAVLSLTDGILFLYAFLYFKAEQEEGTPFTHSGADRIKSLGIKTIVLPLVAVIISAVIYEIFGLTHSGDWNNAFSIELGILLILSSFVFRYGADLESEKK